MIWSFSHGVSFRTCQRRWYYGRVVAAARARDPIRREAYILGKFGSVAAWRGRLVDEVISEDVLPSMGAGEEASAERALELARDRFERQLEFALENRVREPDFSMTAAGSSFAALKEVDDGHPPSAEQLEKAWLDVSVALRSFFDMGPILETLRQAVAVLAQRALTMRLGEDSVRAFPDAIVFRDGRPPLLLDWKVHARRSRSGAPQLWTYAIVLAHARPHSDFPRPYQRPRPSDVDLAEVQLLDPSVHRYTARPADQARVRERIKDSLDAMKAATEHAAGPYDVPITTDERACRWCSYYRLCQRRPVGYSEL